MKSRKLESNFVLCVRNDGAEDLEPRKVYQALPDEAASREDYIRVIDESGDDYLYPAKYFVSLKLPIAITQDGNPACASYDERTCLWGQSISDIDFPKVKPLVCGAAHRKRRRPRPRRAHPAG